MLDTKQSPQAAIDELGLTVEYVFIPFSQSRNKGNKDKSLNWQITLKRKGLTVITTDYSAGTGHCPANALTWFSPSEKASAISRECELGKAQTQNPKLQMKGDGKAIKPDTIDVIYSLNMDSDVLSYASFEHWAETFGYETDSRKAEKIYQDCLAIALKLKASIGETGLEQLNEAFQDY